MNHQDYLNPRHASTHDGIGGSSDPSCVDDDAPAKDPLLWHAPAFEAVIAPQLKSRGIFAAVRVDSSKSLTNRHLLLAALADGPSILTHVLNSRDSHLMMRALKNLGAIIEPIDSNLNQYRITPLGRTPNALLPQDKRQPTGGELKKRVIDCGLAGTVMRFVPPLAALSWGTFIFDGDPHARRRPMKTMINALKDLGADVNAPKEGTMPFTVTGKGRVAGGKLSIDATSSSQFVSALLLVGAFFDNGLHLVHRGKRLPSAPHIEMTVKVLRDWGVIVKNPREGEWIVLPIGATTPTEEGKHLQKIGARHVTIEQDLSNIGPFLAAAQVTGGTLQVPHWPVRTTQAGAQWRAILERFGTKTSCADERFGAAEKTVTFDAPLNYRGCDIDLSDAGELAPTIAAIALFASSPSRLSGIAHLRGHETDRLAAIAHEFNKIGATVTETTDGLEIFPPSVTEKPLHPPKDYFHTYADHRMATTAAVIGLRVPGIAVENIECTRKTLSDFPRLWKAMLDDSNTATSSLSISGNDACFSAPRLEERL